MYAGPKGLASSSWSADIGIGRHYNSPALYHSGRGAGKSHISNRKNPRGVQEVSRCTRPLQSVYPCCHCTLFTLPSPFYPSVYNFLLPRSLASSLNIPHLPAVPQPEASLWVSCMATRCVVALVLAFSTRKVKVKGLDDAKYSAAAIYVTSIVFAVIIVATHSLNDFANAFPALFCTGFLIGTAVILGLVFVPKVGGWASLVDQIQDVDWVRHQYSSRSTALGSCNMQIVKPHAQCNVMYFVEQVIAEKANHFSKL